MGHCGTRALVGVSFVCCSVELLEERWLAGMRFFFCAGSSPSGLRWRSCLRCVLYVGGGLRALCC